MVPLRTITVEPIHLKAMRVCVILLMLTAAGGSVFAQSLADVARQESERRQTVKTGGKSFTNQDLKPVPAAPAGADSTGGGDATTAGQTTAPGDAASKDDRATDPKSDLGAEKTDDASGAKNQAYWSRRMTDLREQLESDQTLLDALQSRINALTSDFVNRDDPAQRGQIANDRQKALAELERLKKAVEQDQRAIPDLEEEARRSGVPAGWLR